jgi:hypothetical protein
MEIEVTTPISIDLPADSGLSFRNVAYAGSSGTTNL